MMFSAHQQLCPQGLGHNFFTSYISDNGGAGVDLHAFMEVEHRVDIIRNSGIGGVEDSKTEKAEELVDMVQPRKAIVEGR